ncbi:MAG: hypothetical protein V7607_1224 [Solirubrobacteraceae bacterium]
MRRLLSRDDDTYEALVIPRELTEAGVQGDWLCSEVARTIRETSDLLMALAKLVERHPEVRDNVTGQLVGLGLMDEQPVRPLRRRAHARGRKRR